MTPTYALKLDPAIKQTNIGVKKIVKSLLKTYAIGIAGFRP